MSGEEGVGGTSEGELCFLASRVNRSEGVVHRQCRGSNDRGDTRTFGGKTFKVIIFGGGGGG